MESLEMTKNYLNNLKKDFQDFAKTENPFLKTNLPKFLKRTLSLFFNVYLIVPLFIGKNIIAKPIIVHRDFISKNIKKVKVPPELTVDILDTKEIHHKYEETIQKEVDTFLEILEKNFKIDDLTFFFRNIQSLDFREMKEKDKTLGYYNDRNNKITLIKGANRNTIIHELFHMASSYLDKKHNISYSGFNQLENNSDLGRGLNEGYTELLANRYSNTQNTNCYISEKKYAEIIEEIVGKDLMQSLYLQANLKGLITELTKYQTTEKIMSFLQNLDLLEKYKDDENLEEKINNCKENIESFLIETYLEKTKIELQETNFKEYAELEDFLIENRMKINLCNVKLSSTIDDIESFIEKYLGDIIEEKKEQIEKYRWEQTELKIKQEQEEWNKIFGNLHFNHEPSKIGPIKDYNFGKLSDDESPKR